jgi:RNA ligase (TIGR02306 family)
MSSLVVKVALVDEVNLHPNADLLELAIVGGWQCVVPKGKFRAGDRVVYFAPDTMLPLDVSERFGVTQYLSKGRVHSVKLRGEPSMGLVVVPDSPDWPVDEDVAGYYGATKYEPPVKFTAGDAESPHPLFMGYTSIENMRHFPGVFQPWEFVVVTEKVHGTNCRVGMVGGVLMGGSHQIRRKEPENCATSMYWFPLSLEPVQNLVSALGALHSQVILYGEVYGMGVQSYDYGQSGKAFAAFDLMIDGKYVDHDVFLDHCRKFGVPTVPELGRIPFDLAEVKLFSRGKAFSGKHIREGVVVKPLMERTDPKVGRVILKFISDDYMLGCKEDFSDV